MSLGRQKRALAAKRLDELSELDTSLDDVTSVVDNVRMWDKFEEVLAVAKSERRLELPSKDLKFCMAAVYLALLFTSYSRPLAVTNCTVEHYLAAREVDGKAVMVVSEHKTGEKGSAKLVMDEALRGRVKDYFMYIRPHLVVRPIASF